MDSGLGVPVMFPSSGSATQHPLRSTGSRRDRFPGFDATMRHSDSRPPYPTRFVVLRAAVTVPCACVRSVLPDAEGTARSFVVWQPHATIGTATAGSPRFLANPG